MFSQAFNLLGLIVIGFIIAALLLNGPQTIGILNSLGSTFLGSGKLITQH